MMLQTESNKRVMILLSFFTIIFRHNLGMGTIDAIADVIFVVNHLNLFVLSLYVDYIADGI